MGRKRLGDEPTVLTTVRIPGEWASKLTAGGLTMAEVIRGLVEREYLALQKILDTAVEVKKNFGARRTARALGRVPKEKSPAVASVQTAAQGVMCSHNYGFKKCPFPNCPHYKWREE